MTRLGRFLDNDDSDPRSLQTMRYKELENIIEKEERQSRETHLDADRLSSQRPGFFPNHQLLTFTGSEECSSYNNIRYRRLLVDV